MHSIAQEKLEQAARLLPEFGLDCWLLGRETGELCDPSPQRQLPSARVGRGLTWTLLPASSSPMRVTRSTATPWIIR
jgi:hypothetical protein